MRVQAMNQRGSVFLTTLIATFLMSLVGAYTYQMATQDLRFVRRLEKATQARQLAEAGLARALSTITNSSSDQFYSVIGTASNFPLTTLGPGTYDASVNSITPGEDEDDDGDHGDDDDDDDDDHHGDDDDDHGDDDDDHGDDDDDDDHH